jgi:hypothetical protein
MHHVGFDLVGEPEAAAAYIVKAIQPNRSRVGSNPESRLKYLSLNYNAEL